MTHYKDVPVPDGTTVKDVLTMLHVIRPDLPSPVTIMFRLVYRDVKGMYEETLYGYAEWNINDKKLRSLDGDSYSLYDEVASYRMIEKDIFAGEDAMVVITLKGEKFVHEKE